MAINDFATSRRTPQKYERRANCRYYRRPRLDAGTELLRISSREMIVGMDIDPRGQRLRSRRLNVRWFQLSGPDLIIGVTPPRWGTSDCSRLALWSVGSPLPKSSHPRGDVEARQEDVAAHVLNVRGGQTVATLQIQHRVQDRLAMYERAVFLHDRLCNDLE